MTFPPIVYRPDKKSRVSSTLKIKARTVTFQGHVIHAVNSLEFFVKQKELAFCLNI